MSLSVDFGDRGEVGRFAVYRLVFLGRVISRLVPLRYIIYRFTIGRYTV
ncbi:hypothetical protein V7112_06155 [Bacillus sp. JJ1566]